MAMNLKHLRTFVVVTEQGSVSKAALRLHTAQPALSRQIMELEKELGLSLFDRVGRGLALSKQGENILEICRDVLARTALLAESAQALRGGDVGSLKIAVSPQILESVLAKFLPRYVVKYPKVKVLFAEAVGRDQLTLLERGDCDIGIGIGQIEAVSAESRFATFQLANLEILAACQPALRLGRSATIDVADLANHPLLLLDTTYAFRRLFDRACRRAGIELNIAVESSAPHTLLAFAEAGHGVAIIQSAVATDRYKLRIVRVTEKGRPIGVPMTAIWDGRRTLPSYANAFCQMLAEHIRNVFPIAQSFSMSKKRKSGHRRLQHR